MVTKKFSISRLTTSAENLVCTMDSGASLRIMEKSSLPLEKPKTTTSSVCIKDLDIFLGNMVVDSVRLYSVRLKNKRVAMTLHSCTFSNQEVSRADGMPSEEAGIFLRKKAVIEFEGLVRVIEDLSRFCCIKATVEVTYTTT